MVIIWTKLGHFMRNVAILGSTSHIAKNLLVRFAKNPNFQVFSFNRATGFEDFPNNQYDLIINCVGSGLLNSTKNTYTDWFTITEKFDNLIIDYLLRVNPDALFISFSSGNVYGPLECPPKTHNKACAIYPNKLTIADFHRISKLNSEAKHRAFNSLNIVDFRIFMFFSRFINLTETYFMSQLINAVQKQEVFVTSTANWRRDFIHPFDLFEAVISCPKFNGALDLISKYPVFKWDILDYFIKVHDLRLDLQQDKDFSNGTGEKEIYYSDYRDNPFFHFQATFSSLACIGDESEAILYP